VKIKVLLSFLFVVMLIALYFGLIYCPAPEIEGKTLDVYRIFYLHFPQGITCYLAFTLTAIGSALYLKKRDLKWDQLAYSSAIVGLLFCFLVIVTGSIWAKEAWGVYWHWDPRETTTLILFFAYLAYVGFRASIVEREKRARLAAVVGILAIVCVPLSYFSAVYMLGLHPSPLKMVYRPLTRVGMYTSLLAFLALMIVLIHFSTKIEELSERIKLILMEK
jgi:heme exporter protein C